MLTIKTELLDKLILEIEGGKYKCVNNHGNITEYQHESNDIGAIIQHNYDREGDHIIHVGGYRIYATQASKIARALKEYESEVKRMELAKAEEILNGNLSNLFSKGN